MHQALLKNKAAKTDPSVRLYPRSSDQTLIPPQNLSEEEQKLVRLYGGLPSHKNILKNMQKVPLCRVCRFRRLIASQERKYFDSGDYALSKAGVAPQTVVGTAIPNPEK